MSDTAITTDLQQNTSGGKEVQVIETEGDVVSEAISAIASGNALAYSSLTGTDWATKVAQLQAVTSSEPVRDHLKEPIALRNIIMQAVDIADPQTGVVSKQPRIIFLDENNVAYHAISNGLLKWVANIIGILGEPYTWPTPIGVQFIEKSAKGPGRYMTGELVNTVKINPSKK